MSINSYLSGLASEMILNDSEKNGITTSINYIKRNLGSYFNDIEDKFIFGSYTRGTILPRKFDNNSDVDLMVVFENPSRHKPQSFLNRLKRFAETYYNQSEIYQSSPTIVLELNHIKFELVPAYKSYGTYYIPSGASDWRITDPTGFSNSLTVCNKNNSYKIKPVIRLMKHWNIQKNSRGMTSYSLEKKIVDEMPFSYFTCSSFTDYIKRAFNEIKYYTDYNKVNTALECINKAIEYEADGMPYTALTEIKKVFPEV